MPGTSEVPKAKKAAGADAAKAKPKPKPRKTTGLPEAIAATLATLQNDLQRLSGRFEGHADYHPADAERWMRASETTARMVSRLEAIAESLK